MIQQRLEDITKTVNVRLKELFTAKRPQLLWESMEYSIKAGGKRLRPALNILAAGIVGADIRETLDIACAIEMIHTYSLIHDDLPALDNDELRRGIPSNHMVYGEAQAILAGDGLLSYAFETMIANALANDSNAKNQLKAVNCVARAAGVYGMVAGQVLDVELEGKPVTDDDLSFIHAHKTADMIVGSLLSGASLRDISEEEFAAFRKYGELIGLVFQIVDDVLDVTADETLGKTTGKDARDNKTTFASKYGIEGAMKLAFDYNEQAKSALDIFGSKADELKQLADMLLYRRK
ncbi:MAG: polyprenyl synthetase family protein [Christensenellaceae bacterium]|nr:polyprenyl synthetase family protein [Christensenellaceae bacterium]